MRNSSREYVGTGKSRLKAYPPGATVTDIREHRALTREQRMARVRARRAAAILENEAIEQAIDEYVKDHAEGWSQYVPPSFDDEPRGAA